MTVESPRLVLASGSPRRDALLARLTGPFEVIVSGAEEHPGPLPSREFPPIRLPPPFAVPPASHPILWSWRKAQAVVPQALEAAGDVLILGSDTIVVLDQEVLGKPQDAADARAMLERLAGRRHIVVTGWAFVSARTSRAGPPLVRTLRYGYVRSLVAMAAYGAEAIDWYLATGEPLDKAGAYAAQGLGAQLVTHVEGCATAVMGLPVCAIRAALLEMGRPLRANDAWHAGCPGPYCSMEEPHG